MNEPRIDEFDYIHLLVAAQKVFSCTEAARSQPEGEGCPSHDSFTRLLARQPPDTGALWAEAKGLVRSGGGLLIHDDGTVDKPYAKKMGLVTRHWSGKHRRVVSGISLSTLLWTDGRALVPTDFRLYDEADGLTKNEHFRAMVAVAHSRGFRPRYVLFDSWCSSLENLKALRALLYRWFTRLKSNRLVDPDGEGNAAISAVEIPDEGRVVHLKGYGMVRVFRTVAPDGGAELWATDDLEMAEETRERLEGEGWGIEEYHRGLKQCCGVERCQARSRQGQRAHFAFSLRAFLRLEAHRLRTGTRWYEAKIAVIRDAIRQYLAHPLYELHPTA